MSTGCFVDARRTRLVFTAVSFGAVLLWILCGSYMDEAPSAGRLGRIEAAGAGRRLLSLEDRCDDAGLADLPSGLTVSSTARNCSLLLLWTVVSSTKTLHSHNHSQ